MDRYGESWLEDTVKLILEDEQAQYRMLLSFLPIARTPLSKDSGKALHKHYKGLNKMIDRIAPWVAGEQRERERTRSKARPGEIVVVLEAGESSDFELFSDATIA